MPVVSIIVPCYNQEKYISECLDSVLQQSFTDFECIIVNDGSTDDSVAVVKTYMNKDDRVLLIQQENGGVASTRNNGIRHAKGAYILPLDGDDKIGKNYLKQAVRVFENDSEVDLVYCNAKFFGNRKGKWKLANYDYNILLTGNMIFCAAFFRKKDFLERTKGYDVDLIHGYEDWEFWLQLLDNNSKVHRLNDTLFFYRQKEEATRNDFVKDTEKYNMTMNYIFDKHKEAYSSLLLDKKTNMIDVIGSIQKNEMLANKIAKIKKSLSYKVFYKLERLFYKNK